MNLYFIYVILNIGAILYAVPYANYEIKNHNKKSAIITYLIALFLIIITYIHLKH